MADKPLPIEHSLIHVCDYPQTGHFARRWRRAWSSTRTPYLVPIPGTTNPARMRENLAAADIILTPEAMADIDARLDEMHPETFGQQ